MKKVNNKGFAISTVIYGLSIMGIMVVAILMATMSQSRSNNNQLAKSIEEDLNRFSRTDASFIAKVGSDQLPVAQEYIVPESGWYKIELWGSNNGNNGGNGAYTKGIIELEEGEILNFYVGKNGSETDVRKASGEYLDFDSYITRIMVAAGAGTDQYASGGTLRAYSKFMISHGGYIKVSGDNIDFSLISKEDLDNETNGSLVGYNKEFKIGYYDVDEGYVSSPRSTSSGGDGRVPGEENVYGGISYIAGYGGCIGNDTEGKKISDPITKIEDGETVKDYYFINGMMLPGVNEDSGRARIVKIYSKEGMQTYPRKNQKLNNVRYIEYCQDSEVQMKPSFSAIYQGRELIKDNYIDDLIDTRSCNRYDLEDNYDLDELTILSEYNYSGLDAINDVLKVSSTGYDNMIVVKDKNGNANNPSITKTPTGIRVSAYENDFTNSTITDGNYIIMPVLSENKVMTAGESTGINETVSIKYYNGYNRQIWSVESLGNNNYKISELSRFKALSLSPSGNTLLSPIYANSTFNNSNEQKWNITNAGDGTFYIKTVVNNPNDSNIGYLVAQTNEKVDNNKNKIIVAKKNEVTTRFIFISVD